MAKIIFGAGCFWGVQDDFNKIKGVIKTTAGYSGGDFKNPTYKDVCSDVTGHAEVVLVEYNEKIISFKKLLEKFWEMYDPTTENRQGVDIGSQYRSAIYYFTEKQRKEAMEAKNKKEKELKKKIVTEIKKAREFYKAEDYHQNYHKKRFSLSKLFRLGT